MFVNHIPGNTTRAGLQSKCCIFQTNQSSASNTSTGWVAIARLDRHGGIPAPLGTPGLGLWGAHSLIL